MDVPHVNLDAKYELVRASVMKASFLSGYGINAARSPLLDTFDPVGHSAVGTKYSDIDLPKMKAGFEQWVLNNAFRDMIEAFALYLDEIYRPIHDYFDSEFLIGRKKLPYSKFHDKGIGEKIDELKRYIPIDREDINRLRTYTQVRNCLAHRNGVVGLRDCPKGHRLIVKWFGWTASVIGESGRVYPHPEWPRTGTINLEEKGQIQIRWDAPKHKSFKIGEIVKFEPAEVQGIGMTIEGIAKQICQSMYDKYNYTS